MINSPSLLHGSVHFLSSCVCYNDYLVVTYGVKDGLISILHKSLNSIFCKYHLDSILYSILSSVHYSYSCLYPSSPLFSRNQTADQASLGVIPATCAHLI